MAASDLCFQQFIFYVPLHAFFLQRSLKGRYVFKGAGDTRDYYCVALTSPEVRAKVLFTVPWAANHCNSGLK